MENTVKTITVAVTVKAAVEKVWAYWTEPKHIIQWCHASNDWHAPKAENDLRSGGKFSTEMAAKDGSMRFDFEGIYDRVVENKCIDYTLSDGRKVSLLFTATGNQTELSETFEMENENSEELQRSGWQAILDNFKKHVEAH